MRILPKTNLINDQMSQINIFPAWLAKIKKIGFTSESRAHLKSLIEREK